MSNRILDRAKAIKDDEFYTKMESIEEELPHYWSYFKNKTVYCNCDDPLKSNFVKYFVDNFNNIGLKKLIASEYRDQQVDLFGTSPSKSLKLEYTGESDYIQCITNLDGDGDFRSKECVELLKESDFIITNPPFSIIADWYNLILEHNKKFMAIAPLLSVVTVGMFDYVMDRKIWVGLKRLDEFYDRPDGTEKSANTYWITNVKQKITPPPLELTASYNEKDYPKYDEKYEGMEAINVDRTRDIPKDYYGIMGVPISWLEKWNPKQFKVLGHTLNGTSIEGKEVFRRILIQRNDG